MSLPELPALAAALQTLFDTYPTDADEAERLTLALESGDERQVVSLQPGQAAWLTTLVQDEFVSCRNAHSDGNGRCAHCTGRGVVGATKPTVWIIWQTDGAGPGRPCLDEATAKKRAETLYLDGLHSDDQEEARLEWTGGGDLYELEDNGQDTGWCVGPEEVETPARTWTCTFCGEDNDDAFAVCPGDGHRRPDAA
ncbi:hypothetical protein [Streptomyces niveus]|uniref:hypothetical protein n=1 Tax=Streptomyces niveus TaxID=193462 RepID=UPI00084BD40A|nr:hypothetical protein [Streptomyces niveus]